MLDKFKKQLNSEFFKHSVTLLSANAISQAIALLAYPFITRIYAPDIFGEFNLFVSIVGILTLLATGKYELAIVLPKSEKKATALFQLSLLLTFSFFFLSLILTVFFKKNIAGLFNQEQFIRLLPYLPVFLLLDGIWQTLNYYFTRQKRYYNISAYTIVQSTTTVGMKCFLGIKGFLQSGLVWGQFCGRLLAVTVSVIAGKSSFKQLKQWDKQEITAVAKTYSNFPKYEMPHALLNSLAGSLPVFFLPFFFEMQQIGLFSLALTLGIGPVMLFSNSVYQVLFRKMSECIQNKAKLKNEFLLFCKMCVIVILPFFVLLMFVPENLFVMLFGIQWTGVGFYVKCVLPWAFLVLLNASLCFIPDLFFKQKMSFNIELIYVVVRMIALSTGVYYHSFKLSILLFCSVSACMMFIKVMWYAHLIKKYESSFV